MFGDRSLNRSLGGAIALIALVAISSGIVVVFALHRSNAAIEARRQAYAAVREVGAFRAAMLNQETGLRGYLLTGRESSLARLIHRPVHGEQSTRVAAPHS